MARANPNENSVGPVSLEKGTRLCGYIIGPKIGQGAFGEIYCAIEVSTGILWAIKTESNYTTKKVLLYEYEVLNHLQSSPYFPRIGTSGQGSEFTFFSMELLGPSLSHLLKTIPNHRFSFSSAIRASYHMLKCIESLHIHGYIHRDIKPGNILTREGTDYPLCLIDFGLSRIFVNIETGLHIPQRISHGFRGTRSYASIHAHKSEDLSRRDDIISWFYSCYELVVGSLPWKTCTDNEEALKKKEIFDVSIGLNDIAPELILVWKHINSLGFADLPNYGLIYRTISKICQQKSIKLNDSFDWTTYLHSHRQKVASALKGFNDKELGPIQGTVFKINNQEDNKQKDIDSLDLHDDGCKIL